MLTRMLRDKDTGGGEGGGSVEDAPAPPSIPHAMPPAPDWASQLEAAQLPEAVRQSVASTKDLGDLATQLHNAQALIGRKGVVVPAKGREEAPDDWERFFNELGRPDSADKYALPQLPEGLDESAVDPDFVKWAQGALHKHGLTQAQFAGLFGDFLAYEQGVAGEIAKNGATAREAGLAELQAKYGGKADDVRADVKAMLQQFGGDAVITAIEAAGLDIDPNFVASQYTIATRLKEDGLLGDMNKPMVISREQAAEKLGEMQRNAHTREVLSNPSHAEHRAVIEERNKLLQVLHPPGDGSAVTSAAGGISVTTRLK